MTPETINKREDAFKTDLTDTNGTKFTITGKEATVSRHTDIVSEIIDIRPNFSSYYYQSTTEKKSICLHFTVGYIKSDIGALAKKDNHVSVQYVVDRQGNIYRLFDDKYWSYHLGNKAVGTNTVMSKQSIGIEISNYGPLKKKEDGYYDAYGNLYSNCDADVVACDYRGYKYFAKMTEAQEKAVINLIDYLCYKHGIEIKFKDNIDQVFSTDKEATEFNGIYAHTSVRSDKFDWPSPLLANIIDAFSKEEIEESPLEEKTEEVEEETAGVEETTVSTETSSTASEEPKEEKKEIKIESKSSSLIEILIDIIASIIKSFMKK